MNSNRRYFQYLSKFLKKLNSESWLEKKNWYTLWVLFVAIIWLYIAYLQLGKVDTISKWISAYNKQSIDTTKLTATGLVQKYFESLRNQQYEITCWMETLKQCRIENIYEFQKYQEDKKRYWFTKLVDGENIVSIWQYNWSKKGKIEYVCVRIEYELSWENIPIQELWEYKILTRPSNEKEIAYKQCIWKWKNWTMIDWKSCPPLNSMCS